jgi:putative endonuclease
MASDRVLAERRGRRAESLAAWYLRLKAYRVLARRYRTPVGEIDLIVQRGRTVAFVEVKHRPSDGEAAEAITAAARLRIARAASHWLATHPAAAGLDLRFDALVMTPGRLPRHIVAAFDGGGIA